MFWTRLSMLWYLSRLVSVKFRSLDYGGSNGGCKQTMIALSLLVPGPQEVMSFRLPTTGSEWPAYDPSSVIFRLFVHRVWEFDHRFRRLFRFCPINYHSDGNFDSELFLKIWSIRVDWSVTIRLSPEQPFCMQIVILKISTDTNQQISKVPRLSSRSISQWN